MVLIAIPILLSFGFWQLQRAHWKEALLADMQAASGQPSIALGNSAIPAEIAFRQVSLHLECPAQAPRPEAGRNLRGANGWAFIISCTAPAGESVALVLGWGERPDGATSSPAIAHRIEGVIAPGSQAKWRLTAATAKPPLIASAPPSIEEIPNNHLSYAMQWFAFAIILAVIYGIWLRRWLASARGKA